MNTIRNVGGYWNILMALIQIIALIVCFQNVKLKNMDWLGKFILGFYALGAVL